VNRRKKTPPARENATAVMTALYRTLSERAAAGWERDARRGRWKDARLPHGLRDPWRS